MIKLSRLLKCINVVEARNHSDIEINKIAYHSKNVAKGDLFVCIRGYMTDGHRYIPQAVANGAAAIIVEDFDEDCSLPQYKVDDSRQALAALSDAYYGHPSQAMKMIGITATNGKTTTAFMTNAILEAHGLNTGLIGTVMVKYGSFSEPSVLTTPESLDLQRYLAQMVDSNVTHAVMEVSSSALELKRVYSVDYDIVALNNISREHIDLHGSFEDYYNIKASLIRNAKPSGWAVLNLDDKYSAALADQTNAQVLTFGVENGNGHLSCTRLDLSTGRARFGVEIRRPFVANGIEYKEGEFDVELSIPGYHSVYNSMAAIAICLLCGIPVPTIVKALKSFEGVERRFQFIFEDDFRIIDDHFANAGNINVTLETLNFMEYNKLNLVYAIRGGRGCTTNRENAETIVKWASKLGLKEITATLSQSHVGLKDKVTRDEQQVFLDVMAKAGIKVHLYDELPDAILSALKDVQPGDVLLLAGCQGMDYGAQIALEQLYEMRPYLDIKALFKPLRNRVAGIAEHRLPLSQRR
jgi:UDP-N-acetylmuramoyl-L-alanyl-D-glutamate--2,6-diaminopimelate ligase